jgi:Sec-independent protein translocase protein TatA
VGFGTEILFMPALGALLLGPNRLHTLLGHVVRARAQFEKASSSFKSQLEAELDATGRGEETDASQK